ncbi:MAG: disulfide bond formation protein [Rickettsiaceae bacterium]|jgi:disulfide bond formation protein DsbB|nr:disulfide bond formation protein [Rickettsiaceae bacterium]
MKCELIFAHPKRYFTLMMSLSATIVLSAIFVEYALKHKACILCLYQRIPYIIIFAISALSLFSSRLYKIAFFMNFLALIASAILASYHFGIEQGFFSETANCLSKTPIVTNDTSDILKLIEDTAAVSCKNVSFTILGLSMAFWNIIASLTLLIFSVITYAKTKKATTN